MREAKSAFPSLSQFALDASDSGARIPTQLAYKTGRGAAEVCPDVVEIGGNRHVAVHQTQFRLAGSKFASRRVHDARQCG